MNHYEGMFILHNRDTGEPEDERASPEDVVKALLEKVGGELGPIMQWANRKLSYPIAGNQTGTYVLCWYKAESQVNNELAREVKLSDRVLRHMVLTVETFPAEDALPAPLAEPRGGRRDELDTGGKKVWELLDYKDVAVLRRMVTSQGKLFSRVRSSLDAKNQRKLRRSVHRARNLALLPFTSR